MRKKITFQGGMAMITEQDVYSEEGIEEALEEDSITCGEEGFMRGYLCA